MNENENSCGSTDLAEQHYANDHKRRTDSEEFKVVTSRTRQITLAARDQTAMELYYKTTDIFTESMHANLSARKLDFFWIV